MFASCSIFQIYNSGIASLILLLRNINIYWTIQIFRAEYRLEICRDRRDRRSCKNSSNCVNFSWKQRIFLQNLHINMKFTHLFGKFAHPFLFQLLKFNIFISINHLYWNLAALFLAKLVPIYAFLVCKTFGTKIRSCKIFDKFQVWVTHINFKLKIATKYFITWFATSTEIWELKSNFIYQSIASS